MVVSVCHFIACPKSLYVTLAKRYRNTFFLLNFNLSSSCFSHNVKEKKRNSSKRYGIWCEPLSCLAQSGVHWILQSYSGMSKNGPISVFFLFWSLFNFVVSPPDRKKKEFPSTLKKKFHICKT